MKIIDILNREEMTLSFEVFPPKKETSLENVRAATEKIALLKPSFMSVTYGAGGGTSNYTIDIAKNIKEKCHVPMMAHLTCISSTKEGVKKQIGAIREAGIQNVMALRGDIPEAMQGEDRSGWDYHHAVTRCKARSHAMECCRRPAAIIWIRILHPAVADGHALRPRI